MNDETRTPDDDSTQWAAPAGYEVNPPAETEVTAPAAADAPSGYEATGYGATAYETGASSATPGIATTTGTATQQKRRHSTPILVAAIVVGAVIGGGSGAGIAAAVISPLIGTNGANTATPTTVTVNDTTKVNAVTAAAAKASPSVVTINVSASDEAGTGSGIVLTSDGYILTNTHVVTLDGESASGTIQVTAYDGKIYGAKVIGTDPTDDLAVIKLTNASGLTPVTWGDSSKVNVGDTVVAIGAPLGLNNTVTDGIVSAVDRSIQIASSAAPTGGDSSSSGGSGSDNNGEGPFGFWDGSGSSGSGTSTASSTISIPVIQTDASINPGNSGGALLDEDGDLIGINVAIASTDSSSSSSTSQSGSIGVGFSIPANVAKRVSGELMDKGKATHGLLGASVEDAADASNATTVGALIASAPTAGGAAAAAGLSKGDVVTQFAGHPITSASDLTAQVRALAGGSSAKLTYVRDGRATTVSVTLGTYDS